MNGEMMPCLCWLGQDCPSQHIGRVRLQVFCHVGRPKRIARTGGEKEIGFHDELPKKNNKEDAVFSVCDILLQGIFNALLFLIVPVKKWNEGHQYNQGNTEDKRGRDFALEQIQKGTRKHDKSDAGREHADESRHGIWPATDLRHSEGIIQEVERKQGNKTGESHHLPSVFFDPFIEASPPGASKLLLDPPSGHTAR